MQDPLVTRAQEGDVTALDTLFVKFRPLVRARSRRYFLPGGDADDVQQEALIGLFKAVRDYRSDRQASFGAFADVCITRQLATAVKASRRHKHEPLNSSLPETAATADVLESTDPGPATQVVWRAEAADVVRAIDEQLSGLENAVVRLHAAGRTYEEIAARLGRRTKTVDNALQRAKRKLGH